MKFILTIDTEADNQWSHGIPISTQNIRFIPRLQELCDRYHVIPTYLVTSEVCDDQNARTIFKKYLEKETAEIGAHLHAWTTPPFEDRDGFRFNDEHHGFANELPEPLLRSKIEVLTHQIETSFGVRPTSFRSGRYGFDRTCAKVLLENGYLVDSSVTPYTDWSLEKGIPGRSGGPNYRGEGPTHYPITVGRRTLWEIPITILPTKFPLTRSAKLTQLYVRFDRTLPLRALRKLYLGRQPDWCRPYRNTTIDDLSKLLRIAEGRGLQYIVMMFHSSELMAGCSPYRSDEQEVNSLFDLLQRFFELLGTRNVVPTTLTGAAVELSK